MEGAWPYISAQILPLDLLLKGAELRQLESLQVRFHLYHLYAGGRDR